jgi:tetratricopeptide (TPR) repeat protein
MSQQSSIGQGKNQHQNNMQMTQLRSPYSKVAKVAFDPFKDEESTTQQDSVSKSQEETFDVVSRNGVNIDEATEENCLLQYQKTGQICTFVTYAQTASKRNASTQKRNDRVALLNNAKVILNNHNNLFDSPQRSLGFSELSPTSTSSHDVSREEGLAPLGGNWPLSRHDRISPTVLENSHQHLHTIHKGAANFMRRGKFRKSLHLLEMVLDCQKNKNGEIHQDFAAALYNVGMCLMRMEEYKKALSAFEESARVRQRTLGRESPLVAASLVKVGLLLLRLRRFDDSLRMFREALTVRKNALGSDHPLTARIYNNVGCVHVESGQHTMALQAFETALNIERKALTRDPNFGPAIFAVATTLQNIGFWYRKQILYADAVSSFIEALHFQEEVLGQYHPTVLVILDSIADVCLANGNASNAMKHYKEILERIDDSNIDDSKSTIQYATTLYKIGRVNFQNNDIDSQLSRLHMAGKILQSDPSAEISQDRIELETLIEEDMNSSRETLERQQFRWI